jgi:hypothetical protein
MRTCEKFAKHNGKTRCARYSESADSKHAMVSLPGLGEFGVLNYSVNSTDVLVGAVAGLAGSGAFKMAVNKLGITLPEFVTKFWPLVGSAATGAVLYAAQRKKNPSRGKGHLVGAIGAGVSLTAWDMMKAQMPEYFGDMVSLPYGRFNRYNGMLVNEPAYRMNGMLVNDPQRALSDANLSQLANLSMGDSDVSGMEDLMSLE